MARTSQANPFGPGLIDFLSRLRRNNNRAWFAEHKAEYEAEVREPALEFIACMAPHLRRISPHLRAEPRKVGGSLMRIYRDVRFSRSKLPYKTNLGIQFRHEEGKDVHAPGLYFHVDPDELFLGAGMWRPDAPALRAVREAIVDSPGRWKRVRDSAAFARHWQLAGESLKRAPRGYDAEHPLVEDLRRKDCIAVCSLTPEQLTVPDLVGRITDRFRAARAYMAWQTRALELPF